MTWASITIREKNGRKRWRQSCEAFLGKSTDVWRGFAQPESICEMFGALADGLGAPDVLVNNAGASDWGLLTDISGSVWQRQLDVNLSGAFHLCKWRGRPQDCAEARELLSIFLLSWGLRAAHVKPRILPQKQG